jgi:hypothetical protein
MAAAKEDIEKGERAPLLRRQRDIELNMEELGMNHGWSGHYNPNDLASFRTFTMLTGTAFTDRRIWVVSGTLFLVAITVACLVLFLVKDAHKLDVGEFGSVVKYLKVFLAFMLGMFMNNSLARWWTTVNTLTDYFNNVEKLIYCANSFGFWKERRDEILRYAIVSCYCLRTEVLSTWIKKEKKLEKVWMKAFDKLTKAGYLKPAEMDSLCQVRPADRAGCTWSFIAAVLHTMFEKEGIKPQAMNRMVLQCQIAVDMVSQLKVQICIQMPFMYAHMLALLVHLNNLLVALTCGLGMGGAMSDIVHSVGKGDMAASVSSTQTFGMMLLTLFIEPILYQAFLQIGTNFCYPFGKELHHIPVTWMISDLAQNLHQMCFVADYQATKNVALGFSPRSLMRDDDEKKEDKGLLGAVSFHKTPGDDEDEEDDD